jgi:hypothetical protein
VKRILVHSFSDFASDPRVNRQVRFLSERYEVVAAGHGPPDVDGVRFIDIRHPEPRLSLPEKALMAARLAGRRFDAYYWSKRYIRFAREAVSGVHPDLVVANDLTGVPLALSLGASAGVLFDAHEYFPGEREDSFTWRLLFGRYTMALCRRYIPRLSGFTTVCESIAELYERDTGVRPEVVLNAPEYQPLAPRPASPDGRIRMIHHGGAIRARKLEDTIRAMDFLDDRFSLDMLLVPGDPAYIRELEAMARGRRVRFLPPVPMRELPAFCNGYDLGVFLLPPTNTNYRFALPNKFFEFVQARVAVAIGPSPEMARVVREHGLGVVSDDFSPESFARTLSALAPEGIDRFKKNADAAARALSAESSRRTLLDLTARMLGE